MNEIKELSEIEILQNENTIFVSKILPVHFEQIQKLDEDYDLYKLATQIHKMHLND
jgi:hypothetical protein